MSRVPHILPDLDGYRFVDHGGPYIEVGLVGRPAEDVINVWDYASDQRTIPFTYAALIHEATGYIAERSGEWLIKAARYG